MFENVYTVDNEILRNAYAKVSFSHHSTQAAKSNSLA